MQKTLTKYWQLFWLFRRLQFMVMMEYRGNLLFWMAVAVMWTAFNYFFILGVWTSVTGQLGGWTYQEMWILTSTYTIIDAFTWSWFYPNMWQYTDHIYEGTLTGWMSKPIDLQFFLMTHTNSFNNLARLVIGTATLVGALVTFKVPVTPIDVLVYLVLVISSLMLIYSWWFIIATGAFWVDRLKNIHEVVPSVREFYTVPRTLFGGRLAQFFSFVIPVLLVTSVPAESWLARENSWLSLYLVLLSMATFLVSRWFLHFSLKRYSSVGN